MTSCLKLWEYMKVILRADLGKDWGESDKKWRWKECRLAGHFNLKLHAALEKLILKEAQHKYLFA